MGLLSLVRGIISRKGQKSTLLIDDPRFNLDCYPGLFLSELELLSLIRLGRKYDIPELREIRQFLIPAKVNLVTGAHRLILGQSPLANIKEILRKYPELLDQGELDQVYQEKDEEFKNYFDVELARFESLCFEGSLRPKGYHFELQGPKWLKTIYQRFGDFLGQEYHISKSLEYSELLHLLGLCHEEKLKTGLGAEELPFYFFRSLSQVWRLQDLSLCNRLQRQLVLLGGDYKKSSIQFWQFYENRFENLLLESFEGVISGEKVLLFSHPPQDVPFEFQSPFQLFLKSQLRPKKRLSAPFPADELVFITKENLLGSETPYRVLAKGEGGISYERPYPELPGSKPDFYHRDLLRDYEEDFKALGLEAPAVEFLDSGSSTLDLRSLQADRRHQAPILKRLPIEILYDERPIKGFEYWGPFRYRSMGFLALSYGIEGF